MMMTEGEPSFYGGGGGRARVSVVTAEGGNTRGAATAHAGAGEQPKTKNVVESSLGGLRPPKPVEKKRADLRMSSFTSGSSRWGEEHARTDDAGWDGADSDKDHEGSHKRAGGFGLGGENNYNENTCEHTECEEGSAGATKTKKAKNSSQNDGDDDGADVPRRDSNLSSQSLQKLMNAKLGLVAGAAARTTTPTPTTPAGELVHAGAEAPALLHPGEPLTEAELEMKMEEAEEGEEGEGGKKRAEMDEDDDEEEEGGREKKVPRRSRTAGGPASTTPSKDTTGTDKPNDEDGGSKSASGGGGAGGAGGRAGGGAGGGAGRRPRRTSTTSGGLQNFRCTIDGCSNECETAYARRYHTCREHIESLDVMHGGGGGTSCIQLTSPIA